MTLGCHEHRERELPFIFCSILLWTYSLGKTTLSPGSVFKTSKLITCLSAFSSQSASCLASQVQNHPPTGHWKSLQVSLYQCWAAGKNYCTYFAGNNYVYTSPLPFVFFCSVMTLLTHVQTVLHCSPRSPLPRERYPPHFWENCNCCVGMKIHTHFYWKAPYFFSDNFFNLS